MGKVPIRLKEVVYTLSPFEQSVMGGLWKDLPHKAGHYFSMAKEATLWCILPVSAIVAYTKDYKEKEKQHHRF